MNFAVSAVDQLQYMAAKRQYKDAAGQLEVGFSPENLHRAIANLFRWTLGHGLAVYENLMNVLWSPVCRVK